MPLMMLVHQSTPTIAKNNCQLDFSIQLSISQAVPRGFCSLVRRQPGLSRGDRGAIPGARGSGCST